MTVPRTAPPTDKVTTAPREQPDESSTRRSSSDFDADADAFLAQQCTASDADVGDHHRAYAAAVHAGPAWRRAPDCAPIALLAFHQDQGFGVMRRSDWGRGIFSICDWLAHLSPSAA